MAKSPITAVFQEIRKTIGLAGTKDLPDGQLLQQFVAQHNEMAFEQLIQRYGPMVLRACRRILADPNDADDAFQATFLVLVRRAAALDQRAPLGNWLYGVALRVARKAQAAGRRHRQTQATAMACDDPTADLVCNEVRTVLDEELQQLPEKYRLPLVLCYLAGKTNQEAAHEIGCPLGSMGWRLNRARSVLRDRLVRRGIAVPAVVLAAVLAEQKQAAVPGNLVGGALRNALLLAAGQTVPPAQAHVLQLAEGVLRTMLIQKLVRIAGVAFLLIGLVGAGLTAAQRLAESPKPAKADLPPVIRSAQSGSWSAPATWEGGQVPGAGARVLIRTGHRIVYDATTERPVRGINVAGTLTFAPDQDTRLDVGLIKIQAGDEYSEEGFDCEAHVMAAASDQPSAALEVGTPIRPIDVGRKALIRLAFLDGMDKQSCPAIVCCGGRMDFHGAPMSRTWVKLGANAKKGDTVVTLAEPVAGWRVGDRIILTPSRFMPPGRPGSLRTGIACASEKIISAIDGTKVTLGGALEEERLVDDEFRPEVANLSRNVIVESADPNRARGHTMYHRKSAGAISYAEFRHLGKEGVLGRYSLHYHLAADTMRGSSVIGASIWDSGNRWITIHGTNYLVVRDCVGYLSKGHGYYLEDGTEIYNVLDRNLAVHAGAAKPLPQQALPFDRNEGAGFWWANCLNTFTRNVGCGNDRYSYHFEMRKTSTFDPTLPIQQPDGSLRRTDVRTLPFVRFEDNECHSDFGHGVNIGQGVERVGPDPRHPLVVRNLKIWRVHYSFVPQSPSLMVDNLRLHQVTYGFYRPNYENHVYRNIHVSKLGGFVFKRSNDAQGTPDSKDFSAQYGPLTVDGLTLDNCGRFREDKNLRAMIGLSDYNPTGRGVSHFRDVKVINFGGDQHRILVDRGPWPVPPARKPDQGVPVYFHDYYGPGRHAKIMSTAAEAFGADGLKYHEDPPLTGPQSRAAEVTNVAFPRVLDPIDDLPPITVITQIRRLDSGKVQVRGAASDNGTVTKVMVNGNAARSLRSHFAEWEIMLEDLPAKVQAHAADAAGNVEQRPHVVVLR